MGRNLGSGGSYRSFFHIITSAPPLKNWSNSNDRNYSLVPSVEVETSSDDEIARRRTRERARPRKQDVIKAAFITVIAQLQLRESYVALNW